MKLAVPWTLGAPTLAESDQLTIRVCSQGNMEQR